MRVLDPGLLPLLFILLSLGWLCAWVVVFSQSFLSKRTASWFCSFQSCWWGFCPYAVVVFRFLVVLEGVLTAWQGLPADPLRLWYQRGFSCFSLIVCLLEEVCCPNGGGSEPVVCILRSVAAVRGFWLQVVVTSIALILLFGMPVRPNQQRVRSLEQVLMLSLESMSRSDLRPL